MKSIKHQLEKHLWSVTLAEVARRCQKAGRSEVTQPVLSRWLASDKHDLKLKSVEAICTAVGLVLLVKTPSIKKAPSPLPA